MSVLLLISAVLFFIVMEAYFSGSEIGLISLNRIKLRHLVEAKVKVAVLIQKLLEKPDRLLSTTLVGTNIAVITSTALFTKILVDFFGVEYAWMTTLILTPFILVFGELIPKTIFRQRSDQIMLNSVYPLYFFSKIFYPIIAIISFFSNSILFIFGQKKTTKKSPFVTREELKYLLKESEKEGVIKAHERTIIYRIFDFGAMQAKQVTTPLKDIAALKTTDTIADARLKAQKTDFSRFPVFEDTPDKFIGLINVFDILFEKDENKKLDQYLRPILFLSEEALIENVLVTMQLKKQSMAILVNIENKPTGLVTIKDLAEQIVGEI